VSAVVASLITQTKGSRNRETISKTQLMRGIEITHEGCERKARPTTAELKGKLAISTPIVPNCVNNFGWVRGKKKEERENRDKKLEEREPPYVCKLGIGPPASTQASLKNRQ